MRCSDAVCFVLLMGRHPLPPRKLPLALGNLHIYLAHGSYRPMRVTIPTGISIGSAVLTGLTNVSDRQTYRPRYCECSNRPLSLDVMRPKNRVKLHESDSLPLDPTQHSKLLIRVEPVPTLTWTQTSTGRRSFAVSGPRTRNRLPATLQFTVCCVN